MIKEVGIVCNRKRLLAGLSFLLLAAMLVGATTAYAAPVKIKAMWNSATVSLYEQIIPLFEEEYPDIDVELVGVAYDDLPTKLLLAMIDPRGDYDLVLIDDPGVPRYADEGLLTDLRTLGEYDWDDFYYGALSAGEWKGNLYAAPIRVNTLGLVYNKKFFRDSGLAEPGEGFTLDEFEQAAAKFTADDKYGFATFYIRGRLSICNWMALMYANGGKLLDDNSYPIFNSDAGVKALEQFVRYQQYAPPGISNWDINEAHEAFKQELVGMIFTWSSSFYAVAGDPDLSIPGKNGDGEFAPIPKGDARQGTIRGVWTLGIPENAPHKDEAWTFLKWVCSEKVQRILVGLGQQSARVSICTDPELLAQNLGFGGLARTWELIGEGGMWRPMVPDGVGILDIFAGNVSKAVIGDWTPKQALDNAAAEVQNLLAKKGYYK